MIQTSNMRLLDANTPTTQNTMISGNTNWRGTSSTRRRNGIIRYIWPNISTLDNRQAAITT